MTDSPSPNSGPPNSGQPDPVRDQSPDPVPDLGTDPVPDADADADVGPGSGSRSGPSSGASPRSGPGSGPDGDLLGLGESKKREDALRRKWSADRATVASRLSGAKGSQELRILLRMTVLGFQFIGEIAAAVLIGYGIDWWRGTSPFWTSIFSIGGIVIALITLVRASLRLNSVLERESDPRAPRGDK